MNFKRFLTFEAAVNTSAEAMRILGIKSAGDAKQAYRKLSMKHHPDRAGGNEEEFKKVKAAYEFLSKELATAKPYVPPSFDEPKPTHTDHVGMKSYTDTVRMKAYTPSRGVHVNAKA